LGEPLRDFAQLQLHFVDHIQWRYEVIRPFVLFADDRLLTGRRNPISIRIRCVDSRGAFNNKGCGGSCRTTRRLSPQAGAAPSPPW